MFGNNARRRDFDREVQIEVEFLKKLHGEDAARVAAEKAARPTNRTVRRKVLEEAHRRLAGMKPRKNRSLLAGLLGG